MKLSSITLVLYILLFSCIEKPKNEGFDIEMIERNRILQNIDDYTNLKPITVTASVCDRSEGTVHDFYSEGDYWWPDPEDPEGPYIRKDGVSNPNNFKAHRRAVIRLNHISGHLASAYILTKNKEYLKALLPHLKAWFVNPETRMNPNLMYAQAIKGKVSGRGIGIIDTVHLVEVALAVELMDDKNMASQKIITSIKDWFQTYSNWLTTHSFGIKERNNGNNHSVCWAVQVAAFSRLIDDTEKLDFCRRFYKTNLLPNQMANNGSFPKELSRTKPYGYSLFNLDAMANLCQLLSTSQENLFDFKTSEGKSLKLGLEFLYPYVSGKSSWPYKKDVMYFDDWPVKQSALLFGAIHFGNTNYFKLWNTLEYTFQKEEIERNTLTKYPLLWIYRID